MKSCLRFVINPWRGKFSGKITFDSIEADILVIFKEAQNAENEKGNKSSFSRKVVGSYFAAQSVLPWMAGCVLCWLLDGIFPANLRVPFGLNSVGPRILPLP